MAKSPALLLFNAQNHLVFANDETFCALQSDHHDQSKACTNGLVMEQVQNLIARLASNDQLPARFTYAGRAWHLIRFTLPDRNGSTPEVMTALISGPGTASQSHATTFGRIFGLTPRETEALELSMKGLGIKDMAAQMKISAGTAKAFLRLITIKMGVSGRAEMMSKLLTYMCATSLTCPFRTSLPTTNSFNPKE